MGYVNEDDKTRQMLDRLRTGKLGVINESEYAGAPAPIEEEIDRHDMTKKMLNTIRESSGPKAMVANLLTEGDNDVVKVDDSELGEEAGKFREMLGGVDFKQYEVYPSEKNVILVGVLDNGIEFKFSKKEQAPYININNLRLDSDAVDTIKKLQAYYTNWLKEWVTKIGEYSQSV